MIKIETMNETEEGFDCNIHIEGDANTVIQELVSIFNQIYHNSSKLFETVLLECDYTKHVTDE